MDQFDSSDEETENMPLDTRPLRIDWLNLSDYGCNGEIGICALPGCRFKNIWRSTKTDIETIKSAGVQHVYVLCTNGELHKYRTRTLLDEYKAALITVHHHPFLDGTTLPLADLIKMLDELKGLLKEGLKVLMHCYGGLGRSCFVMACLLMYLDENLEPGSAIEKVKSLRGSQAIQSLRQYNAINDFRDDLKQLQKMKQEPTRPISR